MRRFAPERLLPLAVIGGALLLVAGELSDTFRFEGAGAVTLETSGGGDRHHYALLILGLFAIGSLVVALIAGSKPAAIAVAAAGVTALLIFLIVDLPDVDKIGTFDDPNQTFLQAKAQPEDGFWVELIGALVLTVCGGAMATLSGEQLRALRPRASARSRGSLPSNRPAPESPWKDAEKAPTRRRRVRSRPKPKAKPRAKTKPKPADEKADAPVWGAKRGSTDAPKKANESEKASGRSEPEAGRSDEGDTKRPPKPASNGKAEKDSPGGDEDEDGSGEKRDVYQR